MAAKQNNSNNSIDFLQDTSVPATNVVDLRPLTKPSLPPSQPTFRNRIPRVSRGQFGNAAKFFGIALLLVVPLFAFQAFHGTKDLKGKVLGTTTDAYGSLVQAGIALQQLDGQLAQQDFANAAESFHQARTDVGALSSAIESLRGVLPIASQVSSGKALLKAGENIAVAGQNLTAVIQPMLVSADKQNAAPDFATMLVEAQTHLDPAADALDQAVNALKNVRAKDVPEKYRDQMQTLLTALPNVQASLARFRDTTHFVVELLGGKRTQRYLVLMQNNTELRPTGGFIGSVALIDVANGSITKLEVPGGGSYDYQGQLKEKVISPEPLHIVNPGWYLQDANWWPDFPTSAKKIMWFYEKSGGPTVDGVLTMTPDVIIDLLRQTGPVDLPDPYNVTLTADNFLQQVQASTVTTSDKPKQMIADLVPILLDRLFHDPSGDRLKLLASFETALQEKKMLLYFPDQQREDRVTRLGWGGELKDATGDYLSVIDTNIGGGKTDGVIDATLEHHAVIHDDGSVDVTVTERRTHYGIANDPLTGTRNVDYVRFYVPKGSTLQSVSGFEKIDPKRFQVPDADFQPDADVQRIEGGAVIDANTNTWVGEEFGKTVFGNWIGVAPGETATASITYRLPFTVKVEHSVFRKKPAEYSLFVQKQPGAKDRQLVATVDYPKNSVLRWMSPDDPASTVRSDTSLTVTKTLTTDALVAAVFDAK